MCCQGGFGIDGPFSGWATPDVIDNRRLSLISTRLFSYCRKLPHILGVEIEVGYDYHITCIKDFAHFSMYHGFNDGLRWCRGRGQYQRMEDHDTPCAVCGQICIYRLRTRFLHLLLIKQGCIAVAPESIQSRGHTGSRLHSMAREWIEKSPRLKRLIV